jgi:multisubunit Na+/H+ antiporter MnhE subunit
VWVSFAKMIAVLAVAYVLVTSNVEPSNWAVALVLATLLTLLLRPQFGPTHLRHLPRRVWALTRYLFVLAYDVLWNGLVVARIVLTPSLPIRPGILAIDSGYRSGDELGVALSAHGVTITPGEMVVEIGADGTMYTHCLDVVSSAPGAAEAQRRRRETYRQIFD